jgi:transcriptional regulator with XRE-family HTH domain
MSGDYVKKVLAGKGFSQQQVAELLGKSRANFNGMLGKDDIRTGLLEEISKATGIPISTFYQETQGVTMNYSQNTDSPIVPESVISLLQKKDEQIDRLLAIIEKMQIPCK